MICIYIVSYNDTNALHNNLESLCSSHGFDSNLIKIFIINNYISKQVDIDTNFIPYVEVLDNLLRSKFSCGHLSRNWNQAIINGFENLLYPKHDIVITSQDDMIWDSNWIKKINNIHQFYTFYTCDYGDGLCSYKSQAIHKIGLWDERFCGLTHQEADFFLRAMIYNKDNSSINDHHHKRTHNCSDIIVNRSNYDFREHNGRHRYLEYTYKLFLNKYNNLDPENWNNDIDYQKIKPLIKNYILYPHFEENIEKSLYDIHIP